MVVDLPAPLGPRKPKTSPGRTSRSRRSTAVVVPKRLVRPSVRTAAGDDAPMGNLHPTTQLHRRPGFPALHFAD